MNSEGVHHVNFACDPNVVYTSYISAKIEALKCTRSLPANCGTAPLSNQIVKSHVYFDVTDMA